MMNKNRNRRGVKFTSRDIEILCQLDKYSFMSAFDLQQVYWGEVASKNGYRRLRRLVQHGWIQILKAQYATKLYYRLTSKSRKWLLDNGYIQANRASYQPRYSSSFPHDEEMNQIRRKLESSGLFAHYLSECELGHRLSEVNKAAGYGSLPFKIPDGMVFIGSDGEGYEKIAIELERSLKDRKRYHKIFQDYALSSEFESILYLFHDQGQIFRFRRLLKELSKGDPHADMLLRTKNIYFGVSKELTERGVDAPLASDKGSTTLRELVQRKNVEEAAAS